MEEEINSTVVIDIEKLQNSLRNNLDRLCTSLCNFNVESNATNFICKIQKLPRDVYKSDYMPILASIGPYHRNAWLQDIEKLKWKSLEYVLKVNPDKTLHDYIEALWELYPVARNCYAKNIKIQDKEFAHMLLLDGCFIIAYICGFEGSSSNPNFVSVESLDKRMDPLECSMVTRDFLLIENQIPFFIVKRIYELLASKQTINALPSEKFAKFFEQIFPANSKPVKEFEKPRVIHHLLHLCHMYLRPYLNEDGCDLQLDYRSPEPMWHHAVEYHVAGVKFKKRDLNKTIPHSLLDVSFVDDVLHIPYIFIDEITTTIFRNLIALERENPNFGNDISTYIYFISQLVSTTEDVILLVNKGIIEHHFESEEEVSNILKSLGNCVVFDFSGNYYLKTLCLDLETYYRSRMKWGLGWLRRAKSAIQALV